MGYRYTSSTYHTFIWGYWLLITLGPSSLLGMQDSYSHSRGIDELFPSIRTLLVLTLRAGYSVTQLTLTRLYRRMHSTIYFRTSVTFNRTMHQERSTDQTHTIVLLQSCTQGLLERNTARRRMLKCFGTFYTGVLLAYSIYT